jgi:hypothetical protein
MNIRSPNIPLYPPSKGDILAAILSAAKNPSSQSLLIEILRSAQDDTLNAFRGRAKLLLPLSGTREPQRKRNGSSGDSPSKFYTQLVQ